MNYLISMRHSLSLSSFLTPWVLPFEARTQGHSIYSSRMSFVEMSGDVPFHSESCAYPLLWGSPSLELHDDVIHLWWTDKKINKSEHAVLTSFVFEIENYSGRVLKMVRVELLFEEEGWVCSSFGSDSTTSFSSRSPTHWTVQFMVIIEFHVKEVNYLM